ncbi:MAG: ABC transporter permease subunit, partial [Chroococcidiopsidaceae cyanobacterium CP_BM_RX_35]|nr:ABC transporter permease subunit [Chroococcidiopsidaceae cyanobacterium CP_BM_RX_35]
MPKKKRKLGLDWLERIAPWGVPILLIIIWQLLSQVGWLPTRILPAPTSVLQAAVQLAKSGELWRNLYVSTVRACIGFLIGGGIGFGLGLLTGLFPLAEKLLDTTVQMVRNIPHLALIPLVILWFGIGEQAKVFLVAIGVLFPIYLNTYHGIRTVDGGLIEMGKVYG